MTDYNDVQVFDGTQGSAEVIETGLAKSGQEDAAELRTTTTLQGVAHLARIGPSRNIRKATDAILEICRDYRFAEKATYKFKRGKDEISDGNIKLAEVMVQCWGHMLTGVQLRESGPQQTEVEVYAWDVQNNVYSSRVFIARHLRDKAGGVVEVKTERDKYEIAMNVAQRRLRACIFSVIPRYVKDAAVEEIKATLAAGDGRTAHPQRIEGMVQKFADLGVTTEDIVKRLGHPIDKTTSEEIADMITIYNACVNEGAAAQDYFGGIQ